MRQEVKRLSALFPALTKDFIIGLTDMIFRENFTAERLRDAVDNVIMTCPYPTPTAANILGYDKKRRLYTHKEYCDMIAEGHDSSDFDTIKVDHGTRFYLKQQ